MWDILMKIGAVIFLIGFAYWGLLYILAVFKIGSIIEDHWKEYRECENRRKEMNKKDDTIYITFGPVKKGDNTEEKK